VAEDTSAVGQTHCLDWRSDGEEEGQTMECLRTAHQADGFHPTGRGAAHISRILVQFLATRCQTWSNRNDQCYDVQCFGANMEIPAKMEVSAIRLPS
jgi:hypothetical protein